MDWFAATCGGAALYAASRWFQIRLHNRKAAGLGRRAGSRRGIPLKAVVANCEAKWFLQELQQAMSGDHTAMVRVSHMMLVGYGTRQDEAAAAEWMRKAWAVQNFKEPADRYLQYEMLDLPNSDIPVLNDAPQQQQQQQQQHAAAPTAAAAGAQAAAHLRQLQRRSSSTRGVAAAAAAAAAEAPPTLQSPSPRARAALDGGCSSGSSGSSNGTQAGSSAAAGQPGRAQGSTAASAVSSRQDASPASASQTAAAGSTQTAQQGGAQPPSPPPPQQQQQRCLQVAELVQQSVAAVHLVTGQGVPQMQQQQGAAVQHWPVSVQVLSDLRSVSSPCVTPHVSPVKQQGQQQQQQQQQEQQVRGSNTDRAVLLQGSMQGP